MSRSILFAAFTLALTSSVVFADDKADRVKKLKEQIAEAEKKVTDLKKELAKEEPEMKFVAAKENLWGGGAPEVGTRGQLAATDHRVVEVVDDDTAVVRFGLTADGPVFIVRGVSTKGWVDDMYIRATGDWGVTGTGKYRGKTVFGLRPLDGAKFEKAK